MDTTYSFECEIDLSDYTSGAHQSFYFSVWSHSYGYEDSESVRSDDVYGKDPALLRLSGKTRYETCIEVSELLRNYLYGNGLFPAVVVTTGKNYPDALSGSYLAIEKGAALLLINESSADMIVDYINHYLMDDGMIYVLGGDGAVKTEWLKNLDHRFYTTILSGSDRYSTNIAILKAADVWGGTYLVCTGKGYADSLSCSAIDLPILLVGKTLNDSQLSYLDFIKEEDNSFYIIGGEGAVSEEVEKELEDYGTVVKRIAGKDRYETSVMIAREFFDSPHKLVLATGANFPDGLSGGPLANVLEAPLVLTKDKKENMARYYVYGVSIIHGYILGGTGAISDELADRVFNIGE